jgi:hypothetical protein
MAFGFWLHLQDDIPHALVRWPVKNCPPVLLLLFGCFAHDAFGVFSSSPFHVNFPSLVYPVLSGLPPHDAFSSSSHHTLIFTQILPFSPSPSLSQRQTSVFHSAFKSG